MSSQVTRHKSPPHWKLAICWAIAIVALFLAPFSPQPKSYIAVLVGTFHAINQTRPKFFWRGFAAGAWIAYAFIACLAAGVYSLLIHHTTPRWLDWLLCGVVVVVGLLAGCVYAALRGAPPQAGPAAETPTDEGSLPDLEQKVREQEDGAAGG